MTYQQTAALLSLAMNYWDNICSKTNAEETAKAWATSLSDIPYNAALKAVQELQNAPIQAKCKRGAGSCCQIQRIQRRR